MATRTWVGTTDTNWGTTTNWLEGAVPLSTDDVVITAVPLNNITLNTSARVCKSIDFTNFGSNTITFTNGLTVSGNVKFISTMTIAGSATLSINATATLTSGGLTIPIPVTFAGTNPVFTLADNWDINGNVLVSTTISGGGMNDNTLRCGANFTITTNGLRSTSTTQIILDGTGTCSGSGGNFAYVNNPITINTAGTITMTSNFFLGTGLFKYIAGTVTTTGGTLQYSAATTGALDISGITWGSLTNSTATTVTLYSNATFTSVTTAQAMVINGFTLYTGGWSHSTNLNISGTTNIVFNGTGTWKHSGTGAITNNVTINTAGTLTIGTNIYYRSGTLTYTAGTVDTADSTLNCSSGTTFNTAGISWNNVTITGTSTTQTLNSLFSIGGTLTTTGIGTAITFAGTAGFTAATWTHTITETTINVAATVTYTVTTSLTLNGIITFKSSTGTSAAIFTLNYGAAQSVGIVTATDIDSSLGQTIWDFAGTLTRTVNWNVLTSPGTICHTSVS